MANHTIRSPSELERIEWFFEPEKDVDGRYLFRVSDRFGVTLSFPFDVIEDSFQTVLVMAGSPRLAGITVVDNGTTVLWNNASPSLPGS